MGLNLKQYLVGVSSRNSADYAFIMSDSEKAMGEYELPSRRQLCILACHEVVDTLVICLKVGRWTDGV